MEIRNVLKRNLPEGVISILKKIYAFMYHIIYPRKKYILRYTPTYDEDGLFTNHNCDFMQDPKFKEAYDLGFASGSSTNGWHIHWRVHVACWLANRAKNMDGDFVECGTNKGMISRAIVHYINFNELSKTFYLLDTFCGLSDNLQSPEEKQRKHMVAYEECYEDAKKTFKDYENVVLVRGVIPDTLLSVKTNKICYLHIDLNCAAPEIAAGEYFWDKLVSGGALLLDDYAYPGYYDQKVAWDIFAKQKGIQILSLPTGQGLILKP